MFLTDMRRSAHWPARHPTGRGQDRGATMLTRRNITIGAAEIVALAAAGYGGSKMLRARAAGTETFEVTHTPEEWKKLLTPEQYAVLREEDTERPFTSPLNHEKRTAISPAPAATCRCFPRRPNSTAARVGRASMPPSKALSSKIPITPSVWCGTRSTAAAAAATKATSSTTGPSPRACATASTAWH